MLANEKPAEWVTTKLGEIAKWGSGGTPSRKRQDYYGGDIPWVKTGDLGPKILDTASEFITEEALKNSSAKYFEPGSVAIAMYGATIGKTSILNFRTTTNQACAVGEPLAEDTTTFLYYLLTNEKEGFITQGKGGAQPNISQALIKDYPVNLPPLAEQKEIAKRLDDLLGRVDRLKARLDTIPAILKCFRQSVLSAATSGKLTEFWREENVVECAAFDLAERIEQARQKAWDFDNLRIGKTRKYKSAVSGETEVLHDIPTSWMWLSVDALASKVVDGVHKKPNYQTSGVPFVTVKNLTAGPGISFENLNYVSEKDHNEFFKRANPEKGDILISKDGTLGVTRQIRTERVFSIFVSVALVKPVLCEMSDFLEIAFSSITMQNQMVGVGSGLQHIHLTDLRKDMVPVPPLGEQTEIVRRVEELFAFADRIEHRVLATQQRVNRLTQSILAKAFRGELTADWRTQHPELITGEHSAQALLQKIQTARESKKLTKKKRSRSTASS